MEYVDEMNGVIAEHNIISPLKKKRKVEKKDKKNCIHHIEIYVRLSYNACAGSQITNTARE